MTTEHFYLFVDKKISRKHNLATIVAIIKSKLSKEIVLVFPSTDAKDIRIANMRFQEDLETIIKLRFCNRNVKDTLKIFEVN